jgi:hypothetical protein
MMQLQKCHKKTHTKIRITHISEFINGRAKTTTIAVDTTKAMAKKMVKDLIG